MDNLTGSFKLDIKLGNDAMQTDADIADALNEVITKLDRGTLEGTIKDFNGNTVGRFGIEK
jgi:hypothetical protein